MAARTVIPFGPQHPVLPEPIHLDLVMEDEKVVEAIPSIGFVHRGLEKLAEKREFGDMVYVAERICGICSFMHAMTYCQALEEMMQVNVPERARFLRVFWSELSRIHSHLLWLGLLADSFGFESLFMHCWRLRERILDIVEETTGGRVIFGSCKPGGVRRDIGDEALKRISGELSKIAAEAEDVIRVFSKDDSSQRRLSGVGVLSREDAHSLGAVGPTARGSGLSLDCRTSGYAAYGLLRWDPIVESSGDCHSRALVRIREIRQSFDMLQQVISTIPSGPIDAKVPGNPKGDCFMRVEQPRGEVVHYIRGNGTRQLERFRVRTPTFANIPALVKMLQGCDLSEVPVIVLSIDPCISCTER